MQFSSLLFVPFAIIFFTLWPLAKKRNGLRWAYLIFASLVFYGWTDWRNVLILITVGLISYLASLGMDRYPAYKRAFLVVALLGNIGLLVFFKYRAFVAENIVVLLSIIDISIIDLSIIDASIDLQPTIPEALNFYPLGISFYVFTALGYLFDIYNQRLQPAKNGLHFFAYLSLFPKLIAGPIERGKDLLPQLAQIRSVTEAQRWQGMKLIAVGLFLKVVIADNLAPVVDQAFADLTLSNSAFYWWRIITAYAFQIYCDFGGYTSIALGLGKWMGYDLSPNFNYPYTSTSPGDFWNCWHITLSHWLRDYIFFPLSRSGWTKGRQYLNTWITMLICGLWHGAAWTFIIWGGLHALYISIERSTNWPVHLKKFVGGRWVALFLVIVQVWIAWVFFRADRVSQALEILKTMFSFQGGGSLGLDPGISLLIGIVVARELYHFLDLDQKQLFSSPVFRVLEVPFVICLFVASVYLRGPGSQFIYFQF